jgi:PAS domain S-box-containing protein
MSESDVRRDPDRLHALRSLDLLDAPAQEAFDRLTRIARTLLEVPAAFISLVDEERDFYLSHSGFGEPLSFTRQLTGETFCHYAMVSQGPLVIEDTRAQPIYRKMPTVESLGVAAYVGVPLRLPSGVILGSFCVIDMKPRRWTEREVHVLEELAATTITEIELRRSAAEAARARSAAELAEARYADLVHGLDAVVWEMDARRWEFTFVSQHGEGILGYPIRRWLTEPGFWQDQILHPDDRKWALQFCTDATEAGRDHELEYRAVAADGRVVWLHDRVRVVQGEDGRPGLLRGVMVDVTERKQVTEALRESEEKFRQIAENVRELFWIFSPDFKEAIYISPAYEVLWGRSLESIYREPGSFLQAVNPEDLGRLKSAMRQVSQNAFEGVEYRITRPDGTVRWMFSSGFPVRDEQGGGCRVVGTTTDVTERKEVEARLASAEAHYRRLVENSPYGIYALDREGRFTELNPAACLLLGRPAGELLGRHISEVIAPEDLPRAAESLREKLAGEVEASNLEVHLLHSSGERRLVHIRAVAVRDQGQLVGTQGIARDITQERASEGQMRLLSTALENFDEGVSIVRFDGQIIFANAAHGRLLGYDPDARPLPNVGLFAPEEGLREQQNEILRVDVETGTWAGRVQRRRLDDGRIVPLETIVGRVDRDDGPSLLFTILRDTSEQMRQEQRLRRAERLASVGTLIGGVAHELNNPLHAITNFAQLLLMESRPDQEREDLETISREADRMAKIVSDLRLIARQAHEEVAERTRVDVNELVRHVLKTRSYALATRNVEVRDDLAPDLPSVLGDQGGLEQVVLNLVVNAEQALAENAAERMLILQTRATPRGVSLHVVDNGPGISQHLMDRIFDPFFTTKSPGEGTGLGLSLVHSIITEHGGEVRVDSEPGKGAAFRIELPRAPEGSPAPVATVAEAAAPRALRILVVDDEEVIRRGVIRYLQRRGHTVAEAAEGLAALHALDDAEAEGGFDVILSDLRMPGLGGEEFMERLREQGNGYEHRLVFLTGDAASPDAARLLAASKIPVLIKPIGLNEIALVVERRAAASEDAGAERLI